MTLKEAFESRRNNFDIIRLVAALAVIYGHAYAVTPKAEGQDFVTQYIGWGFTGSVAVDIFFVISGFLVTASIQSGGFVHYCVSRLLRIYPALVVSVALTAFVLGPAVSQHPDFWTGAWKYFSVNASATNVEYFIPGVFEGFKSTGVNGSLWSVSFEVLMYVGLAGVYCLGVARNRALFNTAFFISLVVLYMSPNLLPDWFDATRQRCAFLFFSGAFYWVNRDKVNLNPLISFAAIIACGLALHTDKYIVTYLFCLPYLVFMVAFAPFPKWPFGDYSYGVYLYGWPVQQGILYFNYNMSVWENQLIGCSLALVCGIISWYIVEKPALQAKGPVSRLLQGSVKRLALLFRKPKNSATLQGDASPTASTASASSVQDEAKSPSAVV